MREPCTTHIAGITRCQVNRHVFAKLFSWTRNVCRSLRSCRFAGCMAVFGTRLQSCSCTRGSSVTAVAANNRTIRGRCDEQCGEHYMVRFHNIGISNSLLIIRHTTPRHQMVKDPTPVHQPCLRQRPIMRNITRGWSSPSSPTRPIYCRFGKF